MTGRIEVKVKNKWYGVCGIGFGNTAAEVLCRELGLGYAKRAFSSSKFGMFYSNVSRSMNLTVLA